MPRGGKRTGSGRPKGSKNIYNKEEPWKHICTDFIDSVGEDGIYVYKHIKDGKVVYVGKGSNGRAWSKTRHNEEHRKEMILGELDVKIVASNLEHDESHAIERTLIRFHQPKYNYSNTNKVKYSTHTL